MNASSAYDHSWLAPLTCPIRIKGALKRIIILLIFMLVPVLNLFIITGWKQEVINRMANGEEQPFPGFLHFFSFGKNVIVLWGAKLVYYVFPYMLLFIMDTGFFSAIWSMLVWFYDALFGHTNISFWEMLQHSFLQLLTAGFVQLVWLVFASSVYIAGKIRYAITKRVTSMMNIPKNILFVVTHPLCFLKFWAFSLFLGFILLLIEGIMLTTIIGGVFWPFIALVIYSYAVSYEYGLLANKIKNK
jgi:hypothetical protein